MYKTFYSANSNYVASGVVHVSRRTQDEKTNKKTGEGQTLTLHNPHCPYF